MKDKELNDTGDTCETDTNAKEHNAAGNNDTAQKDDTSTKAQHVFTANKKYFTISIYAIAVVTICIIIKKVLGDLNITWKTISFIIKIVSPFIVGAFIAFLLSPLCNWANNTFFLKLIKVKHEKVRKYLSLTFTYIIAISFIVIIARYIGPQIYQSVYELVQKLPDWYESVKNIVMDFIEQHPNLNIDGEAIIEKLNDFMPKIIEYSTNMVEHLVPAVFTTFTAIVKGIINLFISFMVSIYMLSEHRELRYSTKKLVYSILPKKRADKAINVCQESIKIFGGFLFGKAIDSLIIGVLCFLMMTIFKFPYPLLISVIVGITNMIPYFGPFIGGGIGGVIIIIVEPIQVIFFALMILALQQFDGLYLGPKILGDSTGLRPLWVIFSITVGGSLFGVLGMFLGVPCVAVIRYLINMFVANRLKERNITLDEDGNDISEQTS